MNNAIKSKTYEEFIKKFEPKKTTDDCYTPQPIFEAVMDWVKVQYGISEEQVVRPFWPGRDYQTAEYPEGCVVLDNPPFSILTKICNFYLDRDIKFFLFAPALTAFGGKTVLMRMNHILTDSDITYMNGARVNTGFVTNLGDSEIIAQTAPELARKIKDAETASKEKRIKVLPKYQYPDNLITAATLAKICGYGIDFQIRKQECVPIAALDAQKEQGKAIFGGGLLLSTKKAKEKSAAEKSTKKVSTHVWELSERERSIICQLDAKAN